MIVVLMGVAGAGKSTLGAALEPPAGAIAVDVAAEPARCVDAIVAELQLPM